MGKKLMLAVFAYAGLEPITFQAIVRDVKVWPEMEILTISGDALIDRSRCIAASSFLDAPTEKVGDVLIMVDHDVSWQSGSLQRLREKVIETEGIVGGIYPKRIFGEGVPVRLAEEGDFLFGTDKLVKANLLSTGFMGIHRKVLEKLATLQPRTLGHFYPFFMPTLLEREDGDGVPEYLSEDWAFCLRAQNAGFTLWADMKIRLQHTGNWTFRVVDSQQTMGPDIPIHLKVMGATGMPAVDTLVRDIADYSDLPRDSFKAMTRDATTALVAMWMKKGEQTEEEWYKRDDVGRAYILDLAEFHQIKCAPLFNELSKIKGQRTLDFGSGIGTMSLVMAEDNEVEAIEINNVMREFTQYRAEKLGVKVTQVEEATGEYDTILLWDVLEHLPNPDEVVTSMVAHLKEGGVLYHDSDFRADPLHPMHHEGYDPYAALKEKGMKFQGEYKWVK